MTGSECPICGGSGGGNDGALRCVACGGTGEIDALTRAVRAEAKLERAEAALAAMGPLIDLSPPVRGCTCPLCSASRAARDALAEYAEGDER